MMEVETYLRNLMPKESESEDHFADGIEVNGAEPLLTTHSSQEALDFFVPEEKKLPHNISLCVTLRPQKIIEHMPGYLLEFRSKNVSDGVVPLSQLPGALVQQCCSHIDILWHGNGHQYGISGLIEGLAEEIQALPTGLLYQKAFTVPPGGGFSCYESMSADNGWFYTCPSWQEPRENERPLMPFGGYFSDALDLEKMMPMYGLIGGGEQTVLDLKAQVFWQRFGVFPGQRGLKNEQFYSLINMPAPYVQQTMAQTIRKGDIQFSIEDCLYISHGFEVIDPAARTLLLHFKQG